MDNYTIIIILPVLQILQFPSCTWCDDSFGNTIRKKGGKPSTSLTERRQRGYTNTMFPGPAPRKIKVHNANISYDSLFFHLLSLLPTLPRWVYIFTLLKLSLSYLLFTLSLNSFSQHKNLIAVASSSPATLLYLGRYPKHW